VTATDDFIATRDKMRAAFEDAFSANGNGQHKAVGPAIELIDWTTIHNHGDEIVEGLLLPGRWTAMVAGAKAGKSTLSLYATVEVSEGRDPFDDIVRPAVPVLYVDGEMGRFDLEERLHELGHREPAKLTCWHASDLAPKLDTVAGGMALLETALHLQAGIVIIDGINGVVSGAEKDDLVWRALYENTIHPLKRAGIAIGTNDNLGKDITLGPRGSSVKMDKADAIVQLARTDQGVKLTTTHRRTSAYPAEWFLSIDGLEGDTPIRYRRTNTSWPTGTEQTAKVLDELGVDPSEGRGRAREALRQAGRSATNETLSAAIRYRRKRAQEII
jgi:hypothetical protein